MQDDHLPEPAAPDAVPAFTPVPVRERADGWTPDKQRAFIELLADTGSVSDAAIRIGMSRESAYRLRRRPDAEDFAEAWDAAIMNATRRLADSCMERAIQGVGVPVFYRGEIVGERRVYSDSLAMFLLRNLDPMNYGFLATPKPYDPRSVDPRMPLIRLLPKLLDRLLRRGRTIENSSDYGV
jgi:hypothetical protein